MFEDLTGKKYGKLIVLSREPNDKTHHSRWKCQCECGNIKIICVTFLKNGTIKSCGCLRKEKVANKNYKHNMTNTRLYRIWGAMKQRCLNKNNRRHNYYGGKGVSICKEWLDEEKGFLNFYNWSIKNGYRDDLTIDRINVNGNYEPSNCRWITNREQQSNRTDNHYITYNNETNTITEWGRIYKINEGTICSRLQNGWDIEKALKTPARKKVR